MKRNLVKKLIFIGTCISAILVSSFADAATLTNKEEISFKKVEVNLPATVRILQSNSNESSINIQTTADNSYLLNLINYTINDDGTLIISSKYPDLVINEDQKIVIRIVSPTMVDITSNRSFDVKDISRGNHGSSNKKGN